MTLNMKRQEEINIRAIQKDYVEMLKRTRSVYSVEFINNDRFGSYNVLNKVEKYASFCMAFLVSVHLVHKCATYRSFTYMKRHSNVTEITQIR